MKKRTHTQVLARLGFVLYCALMLWLLFGQRIGGGFSGDYAQQLTENRNFVPFTTIRLYLRLLEQGRLVEHCLVNLIGNVVMFIPLGWLLPQIWNRLRSFFLFLLWVTGIIIVIEGLQYVTLLGSCDVDDLLLNLIGAVMGYLLFVLTHSKKT